jgi:hypothetical protein
MFNSKIKISGPVQFVLKSLNQYQLTYRSFLSNMKQSSRVSYYLFANCKELVNNLIKYVAERELFKLKIIQYHVWFKENGIITFWFDTYSIVAREYIKNALEVNDMKEISNGISMTSAIVSDHLIMVIKKKLFVNFF